MGLLNIAVVPDPQHWAWADSDHSLHVPHGDTNFLSSLCLTVFLGYVTSCRHHVHADGALSLTQLRALPTTRPKHSEATVAESRSDLPLIFWLMPSAVLHVRLHKSWNHEKQKRKPGTWVLSFDGILRGPGQCGCAPSGALLVPVMRTRRSHSER